MSNTKTTIAGIVTIIAAICTVVAVVLQGGTPDWAHAGASILGALGLIAGGVGLIKAADAKP